MSSLDSKAMRGSTSKTTLLVSAGISLTVLVVYPPPSRHLVLANPMLEMVAFTEEVTLDTEPPSMAVKLIFKAEVDGVGVDVGVPVGGGVCGCTSRC